MQQNMILRLSILLVMRLFPAGVLAVPGMNYVVDPGVHPVARDDSEMSRSSHSHHTVVVTETEIVTVQPDSDTTTSRPTVVSVTVTATAVKTTIVDTVTVNPPSKHSSTTTDTTGTSTNKESGTVKVSGTTEAGTGSPTATSDTTDISGSASANLTVPSVIPFAPPTSTSSRSHTVGTSNVMTTLATITAADSPSSSTSTFNEAVCDDIFCNTDGNKVCIYWAGYTSWDVSLGPELLIRCEIWTGYGPGLVVILLGFADILTLVSLTRRRRCLYIYLGSYTIVSWVANQASQI